CLSIRIYPPNYKKTNGISAITTENRSLDRIYSVKICTIDKMFAIANFFCYHNIRIKSRGSRYHMNFSLDWFLSIPGLLITGGVLLLLIALIILIVTSRKKKDKNDSTAATEPAQATAAT